MDFKANWVLNDNLLVNGFVGAAYLFCVFYGAQEEFCSQIIIYSRIQKIYFFICDCRVRYFIFWIGMRKYVADTSQYISSFNSIPSDFQRVDKIDWEGKGPAFSALMFCLMLCLSRPSMVVDDNCISGVCVMIVLRKYSCDFFFSSFLFITLLTFFWMMNGMRQFICVALLFLCCDWIKDGKFTRFIIAVLLMSTVHTTAFLMIPIYFVARSKPWDKKIALFII